MSEFTPAQHVPTMVAIIGDYLEFRRRELKLDGPVDGDHLHEVVGDIVTDAIEHMVSAGVLWDMHGADGLRRYGFDIPAQDPEA